MKLYIIDIREVEKNSRVGERMFAVVGRQRQEKIEKYRFDKDKLRSLCAGALLCLGVMEWDEGELDFDLHKVVPEKVNWEMLPAFFDAQKKDVSCDYGKNGKPSLVHYPSIHFNVSHSGDYVIAAFDRQPVGIDIQEHRQLKDSTARHFLTAWELEQATMQAENGNREEILCRLWAIKESYVKLTGEGIGKPMKEFRVNRQSCQIEDEKRQPIAGFVEKLWMENYYISVCSF
ncbi:MAG: 4'-phosphopantetheinyl transferase superfamily protein [Lachnospiraceae bacterium]|nr:4'-phosphopantetheinyl transferase superfamily protein [Lachnospiraceae bacterium]